MPLLLLLLFIVVPIAELYVIVQVAQAIDLVPTLALLVIASFIGASLARSQGRAAWERFNRALAEGRVPAGEVFDGAMILLGGALLLTPGFISDAFGLFVLFPPTRALVRKLVIRLAAGRVGMAWQIGSFGAARYRKRRDRRRAGYDYEGTAREVRDPHAELDPPERDERG